MNAINLITHDCIPHQQQVEEDGGRGGAEVLRAGGPGEGLIRHRHRRRQRASQVTQAVGWGRGRRVAVLCLACLLRCVCLRVCGTGGGRWWVGGGGGSRRRRRRRGGRRRRRRRGGEVHAHHGPMHGQLQVGEEPVPVRRFKGLSKQAWTNWSIRSSAAAVACPKQTQGTGTQARAQCPRHAHAKHANTHAHAPPVHGQAVAARGHHLRMDTHTGVTDKDLHHGLCAWPVLLPCCRACCACRAERCGPPACQPSAPGLCSAHKHKQSIHVMQHIRAYVHDVLVASKPFVSCSTCMRDALRLDFTSNRSSRNLAGGTSVWFMWMTERDSPASCAARAAPADGALAAAPGSSTPSPSLWPPGLGPGSSSARGKLSTASYLQGRAEPVSSGQSSQGPTPHPRYRHRPSPSFYLYFYFSSISVSISFAQPESHHSGRSLALRRAAYGAQAGGARRSAACAGPLRDLSRP
jgi:hypothetical protein